MTTMTREDTCTRPPEGWSDPDRYGFIRFTMYDRISESAPERDGWEAYFVAVHGANFTTWTYRPTDPEACGNCAHPGYDGHDMRSIPPECMTSGCPCGATR